MLIVNPPKLRTDPNVGQCLKKTSQPSGCIHQLGAHSFPRGLPNGLRLGCWTFLWSILSNSQKGKRRVGSWWVEGPKNCPNCFFATKMVLRKGIESVNSGSTTRDPDGRTFGSPKCSKPERKHSKQLEEVRFFSAICQHKKKPKPPPTSISYPPTNEGGFCFL